MKRRGIRYVIPIIFIAVLVGAMVTYVLLHKNTEAEKGLDYASLIGVTGDSDFQNYWDTDGWYDLAAVEDGYYYMNFEQKLLFLNLETMMLYLCVQNLSVIINLQVVMLFLEMERH